MPITCGVLLLLGPNNQYSIFILFNTYYCLDDFLAGAKEALILEGGGSYNFKIEG